MPYSPQGGELERLNSTINNSSTIVEKAGANIVEPAHKAVMYDGEGNVIVATNGETTIGFILSASLDPIEKGRQAHILIKDIGYGSAAVAVKKGDLLTVENGLVKPAAAGDFIVGRAFSAANPGAVVHVQVKHMGVKA